MGTGDVSTYARRGALGSRPRLAALLAWAAGGAVAAGCADAESRSNPSPVSPAPAAAGAARAPVAHAADAPLGLETACARDDECGATWSLLPQDDGTCCRGCATIAATQASLDDAQRQCAARGSEGCPMKKCAALSPVACVEGHCAVRE